MYHTLKIYLNYFNLSPIQPTLRKRSMFDKLPTIPGEESTTCETRGINRLDSDEYLLADDCVRVVSSLRLDQRLV